MQRLIATALIAAAFVLGGCAGTRSVVAPSVVAIPEASSAPSNGVTVQIVKVDDQRTFHKAPPSPDMPSLSDGDIENKATTSRAIARKRNAYGGAMGDVLLPQEQTVTGLVQSAVEQGFREAGYRVVGGGQAGGAEALPVTVTIKQFWAWMNPGFWSISLEQRSEVVVQGPVKPIENGVTASGHIEESMMVAGDGAWLDIVQKGLEALKANVKEKLGAR
jgi:uncharacterized lipoprotein YajG